MHELLLSKLFYSDKIYKLYALMFKFQINTNLAIIYFIRLNKEYHHYLSYFIPSTYQFEQE